MAKKKARKKPDADAAERGDIISALGLEFEIARLHQAIDEWVGKCSPEMRDTLRWQFSGSAKYFRPVTIFSCFRALHARDIGDDERLAALAIELIHNMTLIVDDILDNSEYRRRKKTLHSQFGMLPALMTSGYIVSEVYSFLRLRPDIIGLISELVSRLGVAECFQWRVRGQPLGVEDWRLIATEDTGSMFEICACLGARGEHLRKFGQLLGVLYHGCDDVADVRGVEALGGGGGDDIRDAILTLPASIAIRDPGVADLFCNGTEESRARLIHVFQAALPEAEHMLDRIADEARREAIENAEDPGCLITLVDYTRSLSQR